jgi:hypothetical protein
MSESIQSDPDLLVALQRAGLAPGKPVRAAVVGRNLVLGSCDNEVSLPGQVAEHLFVATA